MSSFPRLFQLLDGHDMHSRPAIGFAGDDGRGEPLQRTVLGVALDLVWTVGDCDPAPPTPQRSPTPKCRQGRRDRRDLPPREPGSVAADDRFVECTVTGGAPSQRRRSDDPPRRTPSRRQRHGGGRRAGSAYAPARRCSPPRAPCSRRVPGPGCVVIGPFAAVRPLAGRLLFRDRPQGGGHDRRGRYARTGRAAARRLARTLGFAPTRRRASRCRRDRRFSPWAVRTELCPGLRFQTGPAVGVACGFA